MSDIDALTREQISFAGGMLGPLFLNDPKTDAEAVAPLLNAFASLDVGAAAQEWPFAGESAARSLGEMHEGACNALQEDMDALLWEYRHCSFRRARPKARSAVGLV